ncbi:hypothetical protein [Pseudoxanthomonas dokdonensis]|uniref:Lipoprotein n=1 Tax=Pseudoxanthomonas dokdonensis TaxID=344882 RepID=A0A0R0CQ76_9GAMM|nr:hypothetical protein [Pseudoxanthomonas dokdonensis]KRG68030.1 hypothetical protein ABB29_14745 [Pseudoxanthomonas dokdonensis]
MNAKPRLTVPLAAVLTMLLMGGCDRRDDADVDRASTGTVNPPGETVDTTPQDGAAAQTSPERIGAGGSDPVEPYDSTDATMPPTQNDPLNPTPTPPPVDPAAPSNRTPTPTDSNNRDDGNQR